MSADGSLASMSTDGLFKPTLPSTSGSPPLILASRPPSGVLTSATASAFKLGTSTSPDCIETSRSDLAFP